MVLYSFFELKRFYVEKTFIDPWLDLPHGIVSRRFVEVALLC